MKWMARSRELALLALALPLLSLGQNYDFGPNVRVNDDLPGSHGHSLLSPGQRLMAARGNTVCMVWSDDRTGYFHIYFARSVDGGRSFGLNARLD